MGSPNPILNASLNQHLIASGVGFGDPTPQDKRTPTPQEENKGNNEFNPSPLAPLPQGARGTLELNQGARGSESEQEARGTENQPSTILDFFSGSGTTISTAHKLGRKWIDVEMGEHFYNVIIPRLKGVIANAGNHEPCGVSKDDDVNWQGGGMFKYYELESYEDVLSRMVYSDELNDGMYIFDKKYSGVIEADEEKMDFNINLEKLYDKKIDLAETISNITGLKIKEFRESENCFILENGSRFRFDYNSKSEEEKIELLRVLKRYVWW